MRKLVFFDRDGVVNLEDSPYSYEIKKFFFAPGFIELFYKLKSQDALCIMVTNQSGIHRGIFKEQDLLKLHNFVQNCLISTLTLPLREAKAYPKNIGFDGIYFCPHTQEEECNCRKPKPGMLLQAIGDFNLNLEQWESYILGDKETDMQAGLQAGVKNRIHIGNENAPTATQHFANLKEVLNLF